MADPRRPAGDVVRTIASEAVVELERIRGSRFVATIAPADDEVSARAVVTRCRERDPDASHHCWAFRLADGRALSDDDGEPGGTAGAPILRHLDGADLHDVVCVVTRWFGGTRLGTGGLVRAYGDAAATAIATAATRSRPVRTTFTIVHDYDLSAAVDRVLAASGALVTSSDYGARVRHVVAVPRVDAAAFADDLRDATAGRVQAVAVP